jgi:hypothetical protein
MRERPLSSVPKSALLLLAIGLALQLAWHFGMPPRQAKAEQLTQAPSLTSLRIASFGEPIALARILMLHIQAFDIQPGIKYPYRNLDYARLQAWLGRIVYLDPRGQYPLMMASDIYGSHVEPAKQRQMLDFVYRRFLEDPNRRWRWLANAAINARHDLKDLPLARQYMNAIRLHATGKEVPSWAREMEIYIMEDMNELESARTLLAGLLYSGQITDARELDFMTRRLANLEKKMKAK